MLGEEPKILKQFVKLHGEQIIKILGAANAHILKTFGDGFVAGTPQKVNMLNKTLWTLPITMANSARFLGEVGVVVIDGETFDVLGTTESEEIEKKIRWLTHEETQMV